MNISEVVEDTEVVACMLLINSKHAKILFDLGATKSFISEDFLKNLNCEIQPLEKPLMIELANQDKIPVHKVYPHYEIDISGHLFPANLIPFQLGELDIILGMDWLSNHDARIDCKEKKVIVRASNNEKVIFKGQKQSKQFLTIMQAKKLL